MFAIGGSAAVHVALAGACALFGLLLLIRQPAHGSAAPRARKLIPAGLVAGGLVVLVGWAVLQEPSAAPLGNRADNTESQRRAALASLREVSSPVALTDRGRQVPLYEMPEPELPTGLLMEMERGMTDEWGPALRLIRTGPADRQSDCHGWVFVEGKWWLLGRDLTTILEDNGYTAVNDPVAGDLVLYWDGWNEITHSGIVSAVAPSRRILIESKWAWLGTHLHQPNDHPYGGVPTYYRSPRAGHRLTLTSDSASPKPKMLGGAQ